MSAAHTRILVADDSDAFREGIVALLAVSAEEFELVGEARDSDEAVELALRLQPDVVLMDIQMPGRGGIEAIRTVTASNPHIAVLALSMHDADDQVLAAMQAGACGYVIKGARKEELVRAVRTVADGGAVFGPAIARRMVAFFAAAATARKAAPFHELTGREREILELIARGRSNAQIAEQLVLSRGTVRNHVSHVFAKLQVSDRAQAIVKARDAGIAGR